MEKVHAFQRAGVGGTCEADHSTAATLSVRECDKAVQCPIGRGVLHRGMAGYIVYSTPVGTTGSV